ncbi:1575_t:CDS:10 [Ambispora leptoticha]|uniref:Thioredoxin reductase n=1 Tax=Ambispora leptoticha TaxID=144679 RepID=A0A9N8WP83_9GLOM|nr:1575_t:CDS:10 [Ambispora leptoticha]
MAVTTTTHIKQVTNTTELENYLNDKRLTVVEYTSKHCSKCKAIAPHIETKAKELEGVAIFVNVDVNELTSFTSANDITILPTFQFYRSNTLLSTFNDRSLPAEDNARGNFTLSIDNLINLFLVKYSLGYKKITDDLAFSGQIEEEWVTRLVDAGFRAVIDLSCEGENDHLSNEKELLDEKGLEYVHFPISSVTQITPSTFTKLTNHITTLPKPLLIHSRIGLHASIVLLAYAAKEYGSALQEVVGWGNDFGYDYEGLPEGELVTPETESQSYRKFNKNHKNINNKIHISSKWYSNTTSTGHLLLSSLKSKNSNLFSINNLNSKIQKKEMHSKVIIIGSGPAGHTAALYLSRATLEPVMYEGFLANGIAAGGQLTTTTDVENYPGFPEGIGGMEMMDKFRKQSIRFGTKIITETITKVDFSSRPFKYWLESKENEEPHTADAIIVATGAAARRLNLPGEEKYWQRGISACAVCDGAVPIFRNKPLAVVGGGDSAAEEALFLTKYGSHVFVIVRRDKLRASKVMANRLLANSKVTVIWDHIPIEAKGDGNLLQSIQLRNTKTGVERELQVNGLFYAIGHVPATKLVEGQLALDEDKYIITQPDSTVTSVEGVFAAGDVQDKKYRQAVTSAGSGCMAALEYQIQSITAKTRLAMSVKLFVGGLSWTTDDRALRQKFEEHGKVLDAVVIRDRDTGRSRGFGFVTFSSSNEAQSAIRSLNDTEFNGRTIKVDRASERSSPPGFAYGSAVGSGLYYGYGVKLDLTRTDFTQNTLK